MTLSEKTGGEVFRQIIPQREGRILRQGNENAEVAIYRYVTEGSFDAYMWQALETKARFIAQVMTGEAEGVIRI